MGVNQSRTDAPTTTATNALAVGRIHRDGRGSTDFGKLIEEASIRQDFQRNLSFFLQLAQLGCAQLANMSMRGHDSRILPNTQNAATYCILTLNLLLTSPLDDWNIPVVLTVVEPLTEICLDPNHPLETAAREQAMALLRQTDERLQDRALAKLIAPEHEDARRAIRVRIQFCLGSLERARDNFAAALEAFKACDGVGYCKLPDIEKMRKNARKNRRELEPKVPAVTSQCVTCKVVATTREAIWALLVCAKCQEVAACSRDCLNKHLTEMHAPTV